MIASQIPPSRNLRVRFRLHPRLFVRILCLLARLPASAEMPKTLRGCYKLRSPRAGGFEAIAEVTIGTPRAAQADSSETSKSLKELDGEMLKQLVRSHQLENAKGVSTPGVKEELLGEAEDELLGALRGDTVPSR